MSTLPVRSPLPKSVPSTRSAPAISPISAVATAVPRSLCGCTERIAASRYEKWRAEPLHPVGVDVRRELLDRRREVHDHLRRRRRPPLLGDALADLEGVVELGVVEALRRVLEHDLGRRLLREPLAELGAADGQVRDAVTVEPEDDPPLRDRGRVVEMDDRASAPRRSTRRCARSARAVPGSAPRSSRRRGSGPARRACGRSRSRSSTPTGSRPRSP